MVAPVRQSIYLCCVLGVALGVLALLYACVNSASLYNNFNQREELVDVTGEWSSAFVSGSVTQGWIGSFNSPELTSLVNQAYQNNLALRRQAALVLQRYAQADAASGGQLPNLNGSLNARRSAANSELLPDNYIYTNAFDASLQLTWSPDVWGKLGATARGAAFNLDAALASYQQQANSLANQLADNWFTLIVCRQLKELNSQRVFRAKELLDAANQSYLLGLDSLLNVSNQKKVLADERRGLLERSNQCRNQARALNVQLGKLPSANFSLPEQLPGVPPLPGAGVPSDVLTRRADLISARAELKAAYEQIAEARANRFPSLSLSASASRNNDEFSPLFSQEVNTFSIAAALAIPIYAFGRLQAQENASWSVAAQAELSYIEKIYTAIQEVEDLLDKETVLAQSIEQARLGLDSSASSASIAEDEYIAGTSDFTSWVSAELSRFNALATLMQLRLQQLQNRARLHLALGGAPLPETPDPLQGENQ